MKKMQFIFGATLGLIFAAACGNSTNNNGNNNADSVSTDTMMQTDTTIQDTSMIQYRDSNSTEPNGVIPPTP
jgi:hypothetical protein